MEFAYRIWRPFQSRRKLASLKAQQKLEAKKITIAGNGIVEGFVNSSNLILVQFQQLKEMNQIPPITFTFDGPSRAELDFQYDEGETFRFLYISYQVSEPGTYILHVKHSNYPIKGSPFRIQIRGLADVRNALQVRVMGEGLSKLKEGSKAGFKVSTKYSGRGTINVSINGPSKLNVAFVRNSRFCYQVAFTPTRPGYYFITVKFNGFPIHGSPFRAECVCTCSIPLNVPELPKDEGTCRRPWVFV